MFGFNYVAFIPALVKDTFGLTDGYVGVLNVGERARRSDRRAVDRAPCRWNLAPCS